MAEGAFKGQCIDCNSPLDEYTKCEDRCKSCYDKWEEQNGLYWRCPACGEDFDKARELQGHCSGKMQTDDAHKWSNMPIHHHDLGWAAWDPHENADIR